MKVVPRVDDERIIELARGIVRGDYLVVDEDGDWLTSLILIGSAIAEARNVGLVLVPVGPHLGGYWINGRVPGVTLECVMVAKGDMPKLLRRVKAMEEALFP